MSATPLEPVLERAAQSIENADAILITAGAGMGVDSGLPDFRGAEGFWKAYPAIAKLGLSFSQMANPAWFETDPALAWAFYGHRLNLYRRTIDDEDPYAEQMRLANPYTDELRSRTRAASAPATTELLDIDTNPYTRR